MDIQIGNKIRELRKNKNITQTALGTYLNVTSQTVSKWENNISFPDIQLIPCIATYFGVSIDELFDYKQTKSKEMQIESYSNVIINIFDLASMAKMNGILYLESKLEEYNSLIKYGISLIINAMSDDYVEICMRNMCINGYSTGDEYLDECIIRGILSISRGVPQTTTELMLTFIPQSINNEVRAIIREKQEINIRILQEKLYSHDIPYEVTGLLEFIGDLTDIEVQSLIRNCDMKDVIYGLFGSSGKVCKKILENISTNAANTLLNDMRYCGRIDSDFIRNRQQNIATKYSELLNNHK